MRVYDRELAERRRDRRLAAEIRSRNSPASPPSERTRQQQTLRCGLLPRTATPDDPSASSSSTTNRNCELREAWWKPFPPRWSWQETDRRERPSCSIRGDYDKPGEQVSPGVPAVSAAAARRRRRTTGSAWRAGSSTRATRSRPAWPSTASGRCYFGTGLVKTAEDFGSQGEWPSHPELLDWLATEFVGTGWDVKAHAETDRDAARPTGSRRASRRNCCERDPENRLLARGPRFGCRPK